MWNKNKEFFFSQNIYEYCVQKLHFFLIKFRNIIADLHIFCDINTFRQVETTAVFIK